MVLDEKGGRKKEKIDQIYEQLPLDLKLEMEEIEELDCNAYHEDNNYESSYSQKFLRLMILKEQKYDQYIKIDDIIS